MTLFGQTLVAELAVPQASGVAVLGGGLFLVVDDDRGVYLAGERGGAELIASRDDHRELRDLEGICIAPDGSAWVLSERTSAVLSLSVERSGSDVTLGVPTLVGSIEHIARKSNKGWEGIAIWPGQPARVLACHEAKPKRVGVFALDTLATEAMLSFPKDLRKAMPDVSDLTVDPQTGHLLLLSDEAACLSEVEIQLEGGVPEGLRLLSVTELDLGKKEKAEGLCFDEAGTLWLVTDGDPHLRALARSEPG